MKSPIAALMPMTNSLTHGLAHLCAADDYAGEQHAPMPSPAWAFHPPSERSEPSLEQKLCALANANFKRDLASRFKKLGEEMSELAEAVINNDRAGILEESADCSFVLMDIAQIAGGSLSAAQVAKWEVIIARLRAGHLHKKDRPSKD